ncbi:MAG: hypothetical protein OEQ24_01235 [Gammaproteobacteria bacterium]|nr:hypothetical protein [Gammaproteobacteria bacterium]
MLFPSIPQNESSRLATLHALNILDTSPDIRFDCITRFAAEKLAVPICLNSFIDSDRQRFKSAWGIEATEFSRDIPICAHAICETTINHALGALLYKLRAAIKFRNEYRHTMLG